MTRLLPFLSEKEIQDLNGRLAARINDDYSKILQPGEELVVVVTLKGALFFAADLLRLIKVPTRIDFVRLSSYGPGTSSSGTVQLVQDLSQPTQGLHILVLDEIVDSGRTLAFLFDRIQNQKPKTLKLCSLLSKPSRREVEVGIDYLGTEVEDEFLVGYGLDYGERYRSLKDISVLDKHV
jgi:hypoxanthine phosphoribosyltransferase